MSKSLAMNPRLVFVITAGLALSGYCLESGGYIQPPTSTLASWDGLGPRVRVQKISNESVASEDNSPSEEEQLAKLRPYSKEWWVVFDAINRVYDEELKKKLVICRDCMPPEPDDLTGSIAPQYAAGGYLPSRQ